MNGKLLQAPWKLIAEKICLCLLWIGRFRDLGSYLGSLQL